MSHAPLEIELTPAGIHCTFDDAKIPAFPEPLPKVAAPGPDEKLLTALYHRYVGDYPKFFKMDLLSKLGFLGTELLLQAEGAERFVPREDRAVIFGNREASLCNDTDYLRTITDPAHYFPSPALFVYTLPNIVTGEIAIRNKYFGETCFYVAANAAELLSLAELTLQTTDQTSALVGWVECSDEQNFYANIKLIWKN